MTTLDKALDYLRSFPRDPNQSWQVYLALHTEELRPLVREKGPEATAGLLSIPVRELERWAEHEGILFTPVPRARPGRPPKQAAETPAPAPQIAQTAAAVTDQATCAPPHRPCGGRRSG